MSDDSAIFAAIGRILKDERQVTSNQIENAQRALEGALVSAIAGIKTTPGPEGKAADPIDVAKALLEDPDFVEATKADPISAEDVAKALREDEAFRGDVRGAQGDHASADMVAEALWADADTRALFKGERGEDADPTEVAEIIKADLEFKTALRGEPGVAPTPDEVASRLIVDVEFREAIKGAPGKDVDLEAVLHRLKNDHEFMTRTVGKRGADADPVEVAKQLVGNEDFIKRCKPRDGVDGTSVKIEDVLNKLKEDDDFVEMLVGEPGKDAQPDAVADELRTDKNFIASLKPEDADPEEVARLLKEDDDFAAAIKGDRGDDADALDVAKALLKNNDFISATQGKPGKDADAPDAEHIANLFKLDPDFVDLLKGTPGKDASVTDIIKALNTDERFLERIKGTPGRDADPEAIVETLKGDPEFLEQLKGDPGHDANPEDIADALTEDEDFLGRVRGLKGDKGDKGEDGVSVTVKEVTTALISDAEFVAATKAKDGVDGEDGLDRPTFDIYNIESDDRLDKNSFGQFGGAIWQAVRKTKGDPKQDPSGWRLLLDSVEKATSRYNADKRQYEITFSKMGGDEHTVFLPSAPRYIPNKEHAGKVIDGDYTVTKTGLEIYYGTEWHAFDLTGPKGEKGDRGPKGRSAPPPVSLEAIEHFDEGGYLALRCVFSNGEFKDVVTSLLFTAEEIDAPIRRFAGFWQPDTTYTAGDVVNFTQTLYLALRSNSDPVGNKESWAVMLTAVSGPGGSTVAPLSPVVVVPNNAGRLGHAAPTQNGDMLLQLDTNALFTGNNGQWIPVGTAPTIVQNDAGRLAAPVPAGNGAFLYQTDRDALYVSDNGAWAQVSGGGGGLVVGNMAGLLGLVPADIGAHQIAFVRSMNKLFMWNPQAAGQNTAADWIDLHSGDLFNVPDRAGINGLPDEALPEGQLVSVTDWDGGGTFALVVRNDQARAGDATDFDLIFPANAANALRIVDRVTDLPAAANVVPDTTYIVRFDAAGNPLGRTYVWDATLNANAGGWRNPEQRTFYKALLTDPDQPSEMLGGDLQVTTEADHAELKFYDGAANAWTSLFTEDEIKQWIAAGSLFRGTLMPVPATGGAIPLQQEILAPLPNPQKGLPTPDAAHLGNYWTWVGPPNTNVMDAAAAAAAGGGAVATPIIGDDLTGEVLQVGDWIQVVDQGGGAYGWAHVPSDLLSKLRGDRLYGLLPWQDGSWEGGALTYFDEHIYRATQPVAPGDAPPSAPANPVTICAVPGQTSVMNQVTGNGSVELWAQQVQANPGNQGRLVVYTGALNNQQIDVTGRGDMMTISASEGILNTGNPAIGVAGFVNVGPTQIPPPVGPHTIQPQGTDDGPFTTAFEMANLPAPDPVSAGTWATLGATLAAPAPGWMVDPIVAGSTIMVLDDPLEGNTNRGYEVVPPTGGITIVQGATANPVFPGSTATIGSVQPNMVAAASRQVGALTPGIWYYLSGVMRPQDTGPLAGLPSTGNLAQVISAANGGRGTQPGDALIYVSGNPVATWRVVEGGGYSGAGPGQGNNPPINPRFIGRGGAVTQVAAAPAPTPPAPYIVAGHQPPPQNVGNLCTTYNPPPQASKWQRIDLRSGLINVLDDTALPLVAPTPDVLVFVANSAQAGNRPAMFHWLPTLNAGAGGWEEVGGANGLDQNLKRYVNDAARQQDRPPAGTLGYSIQDRNVLVFNGFWDQSGIGTLIHFDHWTDFRGHMFDGWAVGTIAVIEDALEDVNYPFVGMMYRFNGVSWDSLTSHTIVDDNPGGVANPVVPGMQAVLGIDAIFDSKMWVVEENAPLNAGNYGWVDKGNPWLPPGGAVGEALVKATQAAGDVEWGPGGGTGGTYVQDAAPANPKKGWIWFNTNTGNLMGHDGNNWIQIL